MEKRIAIIDIGSNTIRLVIYRYNDKNIFKEIENIKVPARLQNYLNHEQRITSEGLNILIDSLRVFKEIVSLHKVETMKIVATAAIREAKNRDEIKQLVSEKIGLSVEILSGEREAYYGFQGVINATNIQNGITIDIGGGSTEITKFLHRKIVRYHSFSFGVISLHRQFIKDKIPTNEELSNLSSFLNSEFMKIDWLKNCKLPIIGIGGSARNLGRIDQGMKDYPMESIHLYEMNLKDILTVKEKLASLSFEELQNVAGLSKERADIILLAIEVFQLLYRIVNAPFFQLSQKGIRDGILYDEIKEHSGSKDKFQHPIEKTFHQLALEYDVDLEKREMITKTAMMLFDAIRKTGIAELNENDLQDLRYASYIYNIGEYIEKSSASQHTFYILSNRNMDGLAHRDRIKIALLASYSSKTAYKHNVEPFKEWFTKQERQTLMVLGSIIKFAFHLNSSKRAIVQDVRFLIDKGKNNIRLELYCNKSWQVEKLEVEKQIKHLEHALGKNIILDFNLIENTLF
ncbi:MAG: Ppx/GppA family phosphatase [Thermoanaerobacterium sp.]|nr:Ppx/GppA family phosphatase [Thermoanaerobacterium sp.]